MEQAEFNRMLAEGLTDTTVGHALCAALSPLINRLGARFNRELEGATQRVLRAALRANSTAPKAADLRSTVVEQYLGRKPLETGETWQPGPGGLSQAAIAETVGKSAAWVSRVLRWAEFVDVCGLTEEQDPGLLCAAELVKVDPRRWRELVWRSDGVPAVYPALDEDGRAVSLSEPRPVWELSLEQVERWVAVWNSEPAPGTDG